MSSALTFICAGAGLLALLTAIGVLLGPSQPLEPRHHAPRAARPPRRGSHSRRRLAARRARALSAVQSAHLRDLSSPGDEPDGSA